jgi:hypothetical protein
MIVDVEPHIFGPTIPDQVFILVLVLVGYEARRNKKRKPVGTGSSPVRENEPMQLRRMKQGMNHLFSLFSSDGKTSSTATILYLSHVDGKLSAPALKV